MDSMRFDDKCEDLRQKRYTLKLRIEARKTSEEYLREDIKEIVKDNRRKLTDRLTAEQIKHKNEILELENDRELLYLEIGNLKKQKKKVNDVLKTAFLKTSSSNVLKENFEQNEKLTHLKNLVLSIQVKYNVLTSEIEKKKESLEHQKKNRNEFKKVIEELEEISSFKDERILKLKNEKSALKSEGLEVKMIKEKLHYEQMDENKKGNCLFSEVDDLKKKVDDKIPLLEKLTEKIRKEVDFSECELRKRVNERKLWDPLLETFPEVIKLERDVQKSKAEHTRIAQQTEHMKKNYFWTFLSTEESDFISPSEWLESLRKNVVIEQKKMDDINLKLVADRDGCESISRRMKSLEDDLANEKNKCNIISKTAQKITVESSAIEKKVVNRVQFKDDPINEEKKICKPIDKKVKYRPVKVTEPALPSCEQQ